MERIMKINGTGHWSISSKEYHEAFNRLAAIENILGDDYDLDRLRELVEADRDGRCVVLPVKVGDTVHYLTGNPSHSSRPNFNRVESEKASGFYYDKRGIQVRLRTFHGNH